jgi:hypothetical protein
VKKEGNPMSLVDPNVHPLIKFTAFKELAKLHDEFANSKESSRKNRTFKKHFIATIRKFGRWLAYVEQRLEQA